MRFNITIETHHNAVNGQLTVIINDECVFDFASNEMEVSRKEFDPNVARVLRDSVIDVYKAGFKQAAKEFHTAAQELADKAKLISEHDLTK